MADYKLLYDKWLQNVTDSVLLNELNSIKGDEKEIENRFYKELEFGTGGLRGIIGAGTNCLNIYTIRKATKGICNYLTSTGGKSVAISYDSRINSKLFAENAAMVFAENGIKAYLVNELMPTPFLSFAVRYYRADAGVMVTASHNPSKYNGYKVYGNDGCQITNDFADRVIDEIKKVDAFSVKVSGFESYIKSGNITYMDDSVAESYLDCVFKQGINTMGDISVMYTPLNGTGYKLVPEILKRKGLEKLNIVKEQGYPDGSFKTCPYPNPEKAESLKLGLLNAEKNNSDILLATDPDADRVGVAVRHKKEYRLLTGNETGILLCNYLLSQRKEAGTLPKNPIIIKTIVSTSLVNEIAKEYGAKVTEVLTGFKYIGEQIGLLEKAGKEDSFVLGFEESYGYLSGSYVRDKDAVAACMLVAEMASHYKKQGKTLIDELEGIYGKYGKYSHRLKSLEFAGASGNAKMKELLAKLRAANLSGINGLKVIKTTDYLTQTEKDLPKSNVLVYDLQDNSQMIVRPSGTEPLIKIYMTAAKTDSLNELVFKKIEDFISEFFK